MRTVLQKQTWFVFLMLFVMGWSSIAFASIKTMQMNSNHSAMAQMNMHSIHHQQSDPKTEHHHTEAHSLEKEACHDLQAQHCKMLSDHHYSTKNNCKDCTTLHCQNIFYSLDLNLMGLSIEPVHDYSRPILNTDYSVRYSKGYLQDLLRPPQA